MKSVKIVTMILVFVVLIGGGACSNQEADEKGSVDEITTKAAKAVVDRIRSPIDKAKATKSIGDERMKEMDKALKNR
jgi:hypothetical protein